MSATYIIADDSMFARMLLKDSVKQIDSGAQFFEGASGAQSLELHENNQVDWYLLDINMGEPNGVDTAKILVEKGVDPSKIALVTGNKSQELMSEAERHGLTYIQKAISPEDVEGFIQRLRDFFAGGVS